MMTLTKLCSHIMKLLHTPVRGYDCDGMRILFKGDDPINDPLYCDAAFENALLKKGNEKHPVFFIEKESILYFIVRGEEGNTFIAGPVCCETDAQAAAAETVKMHNMDKNYPYKMSFALMDTVYECALMLFECVSDKALSREQMLMRNLDARQLRDSIEKNALEIFTEYRESGKIHNPYTREQQERDYIRSGDIEALKQILAQEFQGDLGRMAKSDLRSNKNLAITAVTLASRAAIEGGVLPEIAFSLADAYAIQLEELNHTAEVEAAARAAQFHFARLVKEQNDNQKSNPIIKGCKDYVLKHIHQKISLREIAAAIDVNASYLSDLFSKQEGITLTEYIAREKINFAKRELIYSDKTYEEIAHSLSFSSQSHFGRVFKKCTAMTPKEFREKNKTVEINA